MKIAFIADGNKKIGFGHLYRSRSLSKAFAGSAIVVLTKTMGEARAVFGKRCQFYYRPDSALETVFLLEKKGIDIVVTDSYRLSESYLSKLRMGCKLLACIDDLNHMAFYDADVVINQNSYACGLDYNLGPNSVVLAGTKYAILDPSFMAARKKRQRHKGIPRLLVSFGGADKNFLTLKSARALKALDSALMLFFVLGKGFGSEKKLEGELKEGRNKFKILKDVKKISSLMQRCDFALCAAGTSIYELACLGIPAVTICQADNQTMISDRMQAAGFSINLGNARDVKASKIRNAVGLLARDPALRRRMAANGKKIVDGKGAFRVALKINSMLKSRLRNL